MTETVGLAIWFGNPLLFVAMHWLVVHICRRGKWPLDCTRLGLAATAGAALLSYGTYLVYAFTAQGSFGFWFAGIAIAGPSAVVTGAGLVVSRSLSRWGACRELMLSEGVVVVLAALAYVAVGHLIPTIYGLTSALTCCGPVEGLHDWLANIDGYGKLFGDNWLPEKLRCAPPCP